MASDFKSWYSFIMSHYGRLCFHISMIHVSLLRHTDLVTKEDFSGISFPAPVTAGGDHITACIVDVQLRDSSGSMARNDQEGNW